MSMNRDDANQPREARPIDSPPLPTGIGPAGTMLISQPPEDAFGDSADTAAADWNVGETVLGGYRVEHIFEQGGMAKVWVLSAPRGNTAIRDRHPVFGAIQLPNDAIHYAVKRVRVPHAASRRRFLRELQTWADLPDHPNLLPFRFFRSVGDEIAIFTDYIGVGGYYLRGSLEDWIRARKLSELSDLLDVAIQFAWGLHALHQWGLRHCDVKPGNVLITAKREVKVSDYGGAQAVAAAGGATEWTPQFQSPEQKDGRPLDHRTDLWSWGVSVLQIFTGRVAWSDGAEAGAILERLVEGKEIAAAAGCPMLPQEVVEVLRKCFRPEPSERWDSLLDAARALQAAYSSLAAGQAYQRPLPCFANITDRQATDHDRQNRYGMRWDDARVWLARAAQLLRDAGGYPGELEELLLPHERSRRTQAIADLAAYEEAQRHIQEAKVRLENQDDQAWSPIQIADLDRLLAALLREKALVHEHLGDTPGMLRTLDDAVRIYELLVAGGRLELENDLAAACMNRAALASHGRLDAAIAGHERAIEIYERLVASGRTELEDDLAAALMNRANTLESQGQLDAAIAEHDRVIEIRERLVAGGRIELENRLATACMNRAAVLASQGHLDLAIAGQERAIEMYERLVAGGRSELEHNLALACVHRAAALASRGRLDAAIAGHDRAIDIFERLVVGGRTEHGDGLATACVHRANALQAQGQLDAAIAGYDRAINIFERLVAGGRTELEDGLAVACVSKANALQAKGTLDAAVAAFERATEIYERLLASGRTELENNLVVACMAWANVLTAQGKNDDAFSGYDRVIEIIGPLVAGGRRELEDKLALACLRWAKTQNSHGKHAEAIVAFARAIGIYERMVADGRTDRDNLAVAYMARANALVSQSQFDAATSDSERAIEIYEQVVADGRTELEHKLALACICLATVQGLQGKYAEAIAGNDRVIAIYERLVTNGRTDLEDSLALASMNRALVQQFQGKHAEAIASVDPAIRIYERLVADGRSGLVEQLVFALRAKAASLQDAGNAAQALPILDYALKFDPQSGDAWYDKGNVLATLGELLDAVIAYLEAIRLGPKRASAWKRLETVLAGGGQQGEATIGIDRVLADSKTAMKLVEAYRGSGRIDDAMTVCDKLVTSDYENVAVWRMRGSCRAQKALATQDRIEALALMENARNDFLRANALSARNEVGLC